MTDSEWHRVGSRRSELAALLKNPVMIDAFSVLRESAAPVLKIDGANAADVLMFNGIENARRCGFHEALASLHALTLDPEKKKAPLTRKRLKTINPLEEPAPASTPAPK